MAKIRPSANKDDLSYDGGSSSLRPYIQSASILLSVTSNFNMSKRVRVFSDFINNHPLSYFERHRKKFNPSFDFLL
jgi:hypothetical protein